jgi:hypothetical protein
LIQVDALSRRPDHVTKEDDETVTMLPDELFISVIAEDLKDKIVMLTQTDELAQTITECLGKQLPLPMRTALSDWKNIDNLILYKNRVYVPTDADLHREIVTSFHDSPTTGHPGFFKTMQLLKCGSFAQNMRR